MTERLIRRGGKLYRELQYPESTGVVLFRTELPPVDESVAHELAMTRIYFGSPNQPAKCPVCHQTRQSYARDERGLLFYHVRRAWPCRWPAIEAA